MRQTVTNMIGTLPPQFFAVTVTTVSIYIYSFNFKSGDVLLGKIINNVGRWSVI